MQQQIPLVGTTSEKTISGSEELINMYAKKTSGGKYQYNLVHTPGLAPFLELPTFPVKALHYNKGRAFAVTSSKMYEIFNDGSFTELGDVEFAGRVVVEDNGIQVVMVDGIKGFYWDATTNLVVELSGDGWYPAKTVTYQDGYFIFERKSSGQYFISDLLSVTLDPLNFSTAEGQPDNLVGVISDHREVFLFGTETIQVVYNSGAADFPFETNQGAFIEKGCASPYTISKINNTIYFIGSDLMVYQMQGYTPARISNSAVEKTMLNVSLDDAYSFTYQDEGQLFYMLTIPESNITWCYEVSTGAWHKRESYQFGRHSSNCSIFFHSKTLVGDFQNGIIYQMSRKHYKDDVDPIIRTFVIPTISNNRNYITVDSLQFDLSVGVGLVDGQGNDPEARVYYSKDSGKTYGQNFKVGKIGKIGKYQTRCKVNRFGVARDFTFKIEISDPIPLEIGGAFIEVR